MPVMKKLTEQEFKEKDKRVNNKQAIEVYGMVPGDNCACIFTAPPSLLKHSNLVFEWVVFVPDAFDFDLIAQTLAKTMPKRRYFTHRHEEKGGFVIGFPFQ